MSSCPTCGKPVDPLRSRKVNVRAGKVVAYCSATCQAAQETKPTAVPKRVVGYESGPVIEIIHEPATGVVTSAPDRRDPSAASVSTPSSSVSGTAKKKKTRPSEPVLKVEEPTFQPVAKKRASSEPAEEWAKNAEMMREDMAAQRVTGSRKGLVTAVFIVAVAAIAALVAYKFIFVKKATSATTAVTPPPPLAAPSPETKPAPPPPPPAAPAITVPEALDKAKVAIAKNLHAESPRVQRLAAAALARGGDRASSELLVAALKNETSDVARLELAYALARGGDQRGVSALNQAFVSGIKDTQRWAAERIVRLALGTEPRPDVTKAADVLAASLDVAQNRLLSGELLARLGDLRGDIALERIRTDANATPEAKAQATVALGLSNHPDIAAKLHELLADGNARPGAAAALAHLHDATAREVLVEQLATVGQRVRAARALRELEPGLDCVPRLAPLLDAIAVAKDAEQVEAGEAVLVLCGPAAWSARE